MIRSIATRELLEICHCYWESAIGITDYAPRLIKEPELKEYMELKTNKDKIAYPLTDNIAFAIDRYYFNHYCLVFRNGCFAKAISQM